MLIYEALKKDHVEVKRLLSQLVKAADADDKTRAKLIEQVRDELVPHARAEEAVFYNSLRSIEIARDLVVHGYEEHMQAEALLRTLQTMEFVKADWTKVAEKLKEAVEHHIKEEEEKIFSAARQLFIQEEARAMAEAFEKMKPEVREGNFMQNTLDMIANMMPERFAKPLREFNHRV